MIVEATGTRLVIHSNAPWAPTGYGQQVALFAPLLAEAGYDVAISAFYGAEASPTRWNGIPVLPGLGGEWGNDTLVQHAAHVFGGDPKAGIVLTLMDVWPLEPSLGEKLNLVCWTPVDHEPAPPRVWQMLHQSGAVPIAMTRHGERMLGLLDPLYVPHAVDTSVYVPMDREQVRRGTIPPGAFMAGMVAANKGHPSRKGFPQALEAFARFARRHDDAYLYLHTVLDANHGHGVDLHALIAAVGIPEERIRKADQYALMHSPYSDKQMASIYSALDVLLNPAFGEGFGVPVIEAASCGVPSIITDFTAMPEVAGPAGWRVGHHPYWTGLNSFQATPKIDEIDMALEACYQQSESERAARAKTAREHALKYDARRVLSDYFRPALRAAEQRFAAREPVRIPSRLEAVAA